MSAAVPKPVQTGAVDAVYRALDPERKEIRVVHVSGSANKEDTLNCTLQTVSLDSKPKPEYEAISYCWGELQGRGEIRLNGHMVHAPASSINALRQFRRREGTRALWIDAICVNQADFEERAQQVSIMDRVYRNTSSCLIWLGEASPKTGDVIRSVEYTSKHLYEQVFRASGWMEKELDSDFTYDNLSLHALFGDSLTAVDLATLFERPWFRRVWVLQEAVLSPKTTCHWGDWTISWHDVCRTARWFLEEWSRGPNSILGITNITNCVSGLMFASTAWLYAIVDQGTQFLEVPLGEVPLGEVPLGDTMSYCSLLEASDNRDRFYGILGLFTYPPGRSAYLEWLRVDYTRSELEVSRDATRAAIIQRNSLRILEEVDKGCAKHDDLELLNFCTWAHPLHRARGVQPRNMMDLECTCADRPMSLDLLIPSQSEETLLLHGYSISRVSTILTHATFDAHTTGVELGNMINHATQRLTATSCGHLIQPMMMAITAQSNINIPDIHGESGWTEFARLFTEFCWHHQTESKSYKAPTSEFDDSLKLVFNSAIVACSGRQLFLTSDGRIGLGHENLHENDYITALFGGRHPLILRPTVDGSLAHEPSKTSTPITESSCYRFVGLAYIPGIMQGQAIEAYEEAGIEPQTFCLR